MSWEQVLEYHPYATKLSIRAVATSTGCSDKNASMEENFAKIWISSATRTIFQRWTDSQSILLRSSSKPKALWI